MKYRVLTTHDSGEWHDILERVPESDVYFLPEYHRVYELNGEGMARAFVAWEGDDLLFYPFLVRPIEKIGHESIPQSYYDIETVYGYSGPLATNNNPEFLERAWKSFSVWCANEHVVAEFIRFHPSTGNHFLVDSSCKVAQDRETVVVHTDCSPGDLWANYPEVQRNKVRRARSRGLECKEVGINDGMEAFKHLYRSTMERVGADERYYFSDAYFEGLISELGDKVRLFTVYDDIHPVCAGLYLQHGGRVHGHLAGRDVRYNSAAPSNLLVHSVAQWGQRNGFHSLHLGGGRTSGPNDSLFQFKSQISRLRLPFYIGMRVHNHQIYTELCKNWMEQRGINEPPKYFLMYRLPLESTVC